jgi:methyl-accepting chemotaxis protein
LPWWRPRCAAWRSAAPAAREIKKLIGSSVEQVRGRHRHRAPGGRHHRRHRGQVVVSVDELLAVSQGAREESEGMGQIGQAVQDLDRMTQQNAALVEQTAAAAAALRDQAGGLASEVARFRLA